MTAFVALVAIAAAAFGIWWALSVRSALKAIQRRLGADPKAADMTAARAYRAEQAAQRQAGQRQI